jgi:hypothetical protein
VGSAYRTGGCFGLFFDFSLVSFLSILYTNCGCVSMLRIKRNPGCKLKYRSVGHKKYAKPGDGGSCL